MSTRHNPSLHIGDQLVARGNQNNQAKTRIHVVLKPIGLLYAKQLGDGFSVARITKRIVTVSDDRSIEIKQVPFKYRTGFIFEGSFLTSNTGNSSADSVEF